MKLLIQYIFKRKSYRLVGAQETTKSQQKQIFLPLTPVTWGINPRNKHDLRKKEATT